MIEKVFSIQPYKVGTRNGKSLALIIPAKIVKEQKINTSTVFLIKPEEKRIILERINLSEEISIPANKSFQASGQQVSGEIQ
jgi:hypothetical protein